MLIDTIRQRFTPRKVQVVVSPNDFELIAREPGREWLKVVHRVGKREFRCIDYRPAPADWRVYGQSPRSIYPTEFALFSPSTGVMVDVAAEEVLK